MNFMVFAIGKHSTHSPVACLFLFLFHYSVIWVRWTHLNELENHFYGMVLTMHTTMSSYTSFYIAFSQNEQTILLAINIFYILQIMRVHKLLSRTYFHSQFILINFFFFNFSIIAQNLQNNGYGCHHLQTFIYLRKFIFRLMYNNIY